jgi:hypothetical protein
MLKSAGSRPVQMRSSKTSPREFGKRWENSIEGCHAISPSEKNHYKHWRKVAGTTRLELATSAVTGTKQRKIKGLRDVLEHSVAPSAVRNTYCSHAQRVGKLSSPAAATSEVWDGFWNRGSEQSSLLNAISTDRDETDSGQLAWRGVYLLRLRAERGLYLSRSFAYLTGTARFEPPKSLRTAKFMPITFPSRLKSGPPEPPEVVAAS